MNSNSFQLKGLVITIVSALLAVYASNKNQEFILIAIDISSYKSGTYTISIQTKTGVTHEKFIKH